MNILKHRATYKYAGLMIFVGGVVLLSAYVHWSAGLAVWMMIWGNNWEQKYQ